MEKKESIADMLKNTLETYPALKGIFCTNEDMADQTLDALADMENTEQIQIVGFDSGEKQQKAIQEGREYGTVALREPLRSWLCGNRGGRPHDSGDFR